MNSRARMLGSIGLLLLAGGMLTAGGCGAPIEQSTLDLLPADQALQLKTWSTNHSVVFDPRLHSMDTCPFLTYMPARTFLTGQDWAEFAWKYYGAKHREEDNCTCDADISGMRSITPPATPH